MTDAQLTTILTSIADVLESMNRVAMNIRVNAPTGAEIAVQQDAIAKVRALIVSTTKPLPFGSGSVNV